MERQLEDNQARNLTNQTNFNFTSFKLKVMCNKNEKKYQVCRLFPLKQNFDLKLGLNHNCITYLITFGNANSNGNITFKF